MNDVLLLLTIAFSFGIFSSIVFQSVFIIDEFLDHRKNDHLTSCSDYKKLNAR